MRRRVTSGACLYWSIDRDEALRFALGFGGHLLLIAFGLLDDPRAPPRASGTTLLA